MHTIRPLLELVNEWGRVRQWRWWVEVKSGRESGEEELVKAALFRSQEKQVKIWWRKDSVWRIVSQIKHTFVRRKKKWRMLFFHWQYLIHLFACVLQRGSLTQIPVVKETRVESGQFLLLSVLCMLFILVALAVSASFFCVRQRSHLRMKEKLASLGTDTSTDATATYQVRAPPSAWANQGTDDLFWALSLEEHDTLLGCGRFSDWFVSGVGVFLSNRSYYAFWWVIW